MSNLQITNAVFYTDMRNIILNARNSAVRSVDYERVKMYWHLGERIFVEEQRGQDRATYGEYLIKSLSEQLEVDFRIANWRELVSFIGFTQL